MLLTPDYKRQWQKEDVILALVANNKVANARYGCIFRQSREENISNGAKIALNMNYGYR